MKTNMKKRSQRNVAYLMLAILIAGCGSPEGQKVSERTAITPTMAANTGPSSTAPQALTSTFDAAAQQMAKDAAADRAQEDKRAQDSKDRLAMMYAAQAAQDAKNQESAQIEQMVNLASVFLMADMTKYGFTPEKQKCYKTGSYNEMSKEVQNIVSFNKTAQPAAQIQPAAAGASAVQPSSVTKPSESAIDPKAASLLKDQIVQEQRSSGNQRSDQKPI